MSTHTSRLHRLYALVTLFDNQAVLFFARYYQRQRRYLLGYGLAAALQSLLILPVLLLIRYAFDHAIPHGDVMALLAIGAGIFLLRLLNSVISLSLRRLIVRTIKTAIAELRTDLIRHLYNLSRAYLGQADPDTLHTRIVQDSERLDNLSNSLLSGLLPALCAGTALFITLLVLNWWLVTITAVLLPLLWLTGRYTGRLVKRRVYTFQRAFEAYSKGIYFALRQMDLTRSKAYEDAEIVRQQGIIHHLRDAGQQMALSFALHGQVQRTLTGLAGLVILVAGGAAVATGTMTLGDLMAFYVAAGLLNGHIDTLLGSLPELISGHESLVTLHTLIRTGEAAPYHGQQRPAAFTGSIELCHVTFGYTDRPVLRQIDLTLTPGAHIAIVGPNSAGKSTLIQLITGHFRPQQGELRADGIAYDTLDIRALRRSLGLVPQHPSFFAGSILDNLRYGHPTAREAEVSAAAHLALADEFIDRLPHGYATPIGEGGILLSGGERQRLAIARALLGKPRCLLLDEPTNHLDITTIRRLLHTLRALPESPTIVLISHDPSVTGTADIIYRLDNGRLSLLSATPDTANAL